MQEISTVKKRLAEFLKHLGIGQAKFAENAGLSKGFANNVGDSIRTDNLNKITSVYPELNTAWLLTGEGSMLKNESNVTSAIPMPEDSAPFLTLPNGIEYHKMPAEGYYMMYVPFVPIKAYAKYVDEHRDIEEMETERFGFIVKEIYHGDYKAFEIKGDSMDEGTRISLIDGDVVLAKEVPKDLWRYPLHISDKPNWIIVLNGTIICKQIILHDTEAGNIVCHSLNPSPAYADFTIKLDDVRQLYNIVQYTRFVN